MFGIFEKKNALKSFLFLPFFLNAEFYQENFSFLQRNDGNDKNSANKLPNPELGDSSDVNITVIYRDHPYIKLPPNWDARTEERKEEESVQEDEKSSESSNAINEILKNAKVTIRKVKKGSPKRNNARKSAKVPTTSYYLPFVLRNEKENLSGRSNKIEGKNSKKNENFVYCDECDKFLKPTSILGHKRYVHKQIKLHLCQTCGYRAHTGSILRQHVQAVHVGYTFPCDECPLKFNLLKRLRRHKQLKHSKEPVTIEKKHVCHYCGHRFEKKFHLNNHLLTHTNETPYKCEYCDKKFKYKWALNQHQRLHTGVKGYKCQFCDKIFSQFNSKKIHEFKIHGIGYENQKLETEEVEFKLESVEEL